MYLLLLFLLASSALGDTLPFVIRAQTDFDRVALPPHPQIADAAACVQSQAALMPVARPEELSQVHYRKGYCLLVGAILTHAKSDLLEAGGEFRAAQEVPPPRAGVATPPPDTSALRVLAAIGRLKAGPDPKDLTVLQHELEEATREPSCRGTIMPSGSCQAVIATGRLWLAWIAQRQDRTGDAARILAAFPDSGWRYWAAGQEALAAHRYSEAVSALEEAVRRLSGHSGLQDTVQLFTPQPDIPSVQFALGTAQYFAGEFEAARQSLNLVVQARRDDARAIFLRGLARAGLGDTKAALEDYNLASRVALAHAGEPFAAGDGHLYRGVWLFRKGDAEHAEGEFAAALNSGVEPSAEQDLKAWWRMAAVARGECGASAGYLNDSLGAVSPAFPKHEAQALLEKCQKISALRQ